MVSTPSPHESASTSNPSHQFAPIQSLSTTPLSTTTPITGRFPSSAMVPGRTQSLGETGVVLQGSGALMGANGAYPSSSVPSQFGHGTGVAVNSGEEGNNNLMWLLDFKLDFFNDPDTGRAQCKAIIQIYISITFCKLKCDIKIDGVVTPSLQ